MLIKLSSHCHHNHLPSQLFVLKQSNFTLRAPQNMTDLFLPSYTTAAISDTSLDTETKDPQSPIITMHVSWWLKIIGIQIVIIPAQPSLPKDRFIFIMLLLFRSANLYTNYIV